MDRKTKRSVAVVAGLTAVLALSPVAGPLTTALADEGTSADSTVGQTVDTETPASKSFGAMDLSWFEGELHFGTRLWMGPRGLHRIVDSDHNGFCDTCGGWIGWPGCDRPGEQDPVPVTYTVAFYNGETRVGAVTKGDIFKVSDYINALPTLKSLEKEGYTLVWVDKETGEEVSADAKVTEGRNLLATWKKIEDPVPVTYTVTFDDLVEDTQDQVVTVEAGTSVSEAAAEVTNPTREGYSFQGWYTSTDYTTEFSFDAAINEDTTVYAKWVENSTEKPDTETPGTEKPDTETPGTDAEQPGTGTETPGTGTEDSNTDNENPGTGTEQPGTDTENPGTDTETPGSDDNADVVTPNDNADASDDASDDAADATDKSDDASKKADETTNEDKSAAEDKSADEDAPPSTGDASVAVSGIAALGTAVAGLGAFLRRRR